MTARYSSRRANRDLRRYRLLRWYEEIAELWQRGVRYPETFNAKLGRAVGVEQ